MNHRVDTRPRSGPMRGTGRRGVLLGTAAALLATIALAPLAVATAAAPPPSPVTLNPGSCAWPAQLDPGVSNVAFPDSSARYFILALPAVPGETLTVTGAYPHTRYISFTTYDAFGQAVDNLNDQAIHPSAGSTDPFLVGADRNAVRRAYRITVVFGRRPASPPPNTVYTTSADRAHAARNFLLIYRIYLSDNGRGLTGGEPLPAVRLNLPGHVSRTLPTCPAASVPVASELSRRIGLLGTAFPPVPAPGVDPPVWHKFYNLATSFIQSTDNGVTGTTISDAATPLTLRLPSGGALNNLDNSYISTVLGKGHGDVAIIHGRLPTFPATDEGEPTMGTGQLRYWSLCSNEEATSRFWACLPDYRTVIDAQRDFTIVVSTSQARPRNATAACGINWLPLGPGPDTVLIMRNMLPDSTFAQAIQNVSLGREQAGMGAYYPVTRYTTTAEVERLGCPG